MVSETAADGPRFEFGKNWSRFVQKNLSEDRIVAAQRKILDFTGLADLQGKTFLDIGCGSGLHSLAAWRSGAATVRSFDYDLDSVRATEMLAQLAGTPPNWAVEQGSVLDDEFMSSLGSFDLVYSWGVLHHTGDVWKALQNATDRVAPKGSLYIALYAADVQIDPPPQYWLDLKRRYNTASLPIKRLMELQYIWRFGMQGKIKNLRYEIPKVLSRDRARGMEYMTDIRDWLGGWPMQFVWDSEVITKCESRGFSLTNIDTGQACSEYLFTRNN